MRCQDDVASRRVLTPAMCMPIFLDWALQLMYVYDQLMIVISSSGILATLGMGAGPSKLREKQRCSMMALLCVTGA